MIPETFDDDYYAVLGVRRTATAAQIKHAFRSKAKLLHPDRNRSANATDEFIRLGEAYRVLRDDDQRLVFDAFQATMAPPFARRRPVWRAAAVVVALVVSIGAASTFGYLALSGGSATVVAESASAKPVSVASPPVPAPVGPAIARVSPVRVSQAQIPRPRLAEPRHPVPPPVTAPPASPARASAVTPEDDDTLVASLSDSVDAPFAIPRGAIAANVVPSGNADARDTSGGQTQLASATAAPSQRVDHRLARQVGVAPKPATVPAPAASATPRQAAAHPVVRAAARPPYPVRVARPYPYRVATYPPYPRASVRRPPVRRYQAPRWSAARSAPADDWPF